MKPITINYTVQERKKVEKKAYIEDPKNIYVKYMLDGRDIRALYFELRERRGSGHRERYTHAIIIGKWGIEICDVGETPLHTAETALKYENRCEIITEAEFDHYFEMEKENLTLLNERMLK